MVKFSIGVMEALRSNLGHSGGSLFSRFAPFTRPKTEGQSTLRFSFIFSQKLHFLSLLIFHEDDGIVHELFNHIFIPFSYLLHPVHLHQYNQISKALVILRLRDCTALKECVEQCFLLTEELNLPPPFFCHKVRMTYADLPQQ